MSNALKCHVLTWGQPKDVEAFTTSFEREQFNAHVPIPVGDQPTADCDESYSSRHPEVKYWGTRFIYPYPRLVTTSESAVIQRELSLVEREGYELYASPTPGDSVALITFTVPSDPPSLWANRVINQYRDLGLTFMIRWWDLDNYHRCLVCGALDGICLRAGAFWSVSGVAADANSRAAFWWGKTPCRCGDMQESRQIGDDDFCENDRAIVAHTAFEDDADSIRIITTTKTGKRFMVRVGVPAGEAAAVVGEINEINAVLGGPGINGCPGTSGL